MSVGCPAAQALWPGLRVTPGCTVQVLRPQRALETPAWSCSTLPHSPRNREVGMVGLGAKGGGSAASQGLWAEQRGQNLPWGSLRAPQPEGYSAPAQIPLVGETWKASQWPHGYLIPPTQGSGPAQHPPPPPTRPHPGCSLASPGAESPWVLPSPVTGAGDTGRAVAWRCDSHLPPVARALSAHLGPAAP